MAARVAVIYYSATGNVHGLAQAVTEGAEQAGAEVRLRHVEELASELLISQSQYWGRHRSQVAEAPVATLEDLEWADGVALGTPTRFGNVSRAAEAVHRPVRSALATGKLADKVGTAFTSSQTTHGGQESTILALNNTLYHWGCSSSRWVTRCRRSSPPAATRTGPRTPATTASQVGRDGNDAGPIPGPAARPRCERRRRRSKPRRVRGEETTGDELRLAISLGPGGTRVGTYLHGLQ